MKRTITVFVLGILLGAALMGTAQPRPAAAQSRKAAAPAITPAAAQPDRVAALEARVNTMNDRCEEAHHDTEYVKQMQAGVEAYYEKAFNTQVLTLSIFGLLITVILGLASMFGFGVFDKKIGMEIEKANSKQITIFEQRLRETTSKLHDENQTAVTTAAQAQEKIFEQRLQVDLGKLQNENERKLTQTIDELQQRVQFNIAFVQGIGFVALNQHDVAITSFQQAIDAYVASPRGSISKEDCATTIRNMFVSISAKEKDKFDEAARRELKTERLIKLPEETRMAAAEFPPLAEAMKPEAPPSAGTQPATEPPPQPTPSTEPPQQPPPTPTPGTPPEGTA